MTRALVTGAGGFVASHMIEYLLAETDWEVVGTLRHHEPLDNLGSVVDHIAYGTQGGRLSIAYMDLTDAHACADAMKYNKPDYIFHLAAEAYPGASFIQPTTFFNANIIGTTHLLQAVVAHCREAWVQVCSSSEVYGRTLADECPITEDAPMRPASPYSISKVGVDLLGRLWADAYGLRTVTTRMFTHTGARRGDYYAESTFAKQIAAIEAGLWSPPIMHGNLDSLRTIADVRDAVRAYHMALTVNPERGSVFNIGGDTTLTVGQILGELMDIAGVRYDTCIDQTRLRPVDADLQVPDTTKFREHTGWRPQIEARETLAWLLNWWRAEIAAGRIVLPR